MPDFLGCGKGFGFRVLGFGLRVLCSGCGYVVLCFVRFVVWKWRSKGEIEERRGTGFGWVGKEEREKQGVGRKMMGEREKERDTACRDKWRGKDNNLAVVGSHEGLDSLGGLTQVVVGDLGEKVVHHVGSDVVVDLPKKTRQRQPAPGSLC